MFLEDVPITTIFSFLRKKNLENNLLRLVHDNNFAGIQNLVQEYSEIEVLTKLIDICQTKDRLRILIKFFNHYSVNDKTMLKNALFKGIEQGASANDIQDLINLGANVNSVNADMDTPLLLAVRHQNVQVVKLLLKSGSDPNTPDVKLHTPLHVAVHIGSVECAKALLNFRSKDLPVIPISYMRGQLLIEFLHSCRKLRANIDAQDRYGRTSLMIACCRDDSNMFHCLMDHNPDINKQDLYGKTALMHSILRKHLGLSFVLLNSPNIDLHVRDKSGNSVLDLAVSEPAILSKFNKLR